MTTPIVVTPVTDKAVLHDLKMLEQLFTLRNLEVNVQDMAQLEHREDLPVFAFMDEGQYDFPHPYVVGIRWDFGDIEVLLFFPEYASSRLPGSSHFNDHLQVGTIGNIPPYEVSSLIRHLRHELAFGGRKIERLSWR